jgi:CxxC motif-containing protein (DUF1111 family)
MRFLVSITVFLVASALLAPGMRSQSSSMFGQSESGRSSRPSGNGATEAPTGFVLESNGFAEEFCANQRALASSSNSPRIPADECFFQAAAEEFTGPETVADGLGPVFNAAGCGECHLMPILGGSSQVTEKRVGFFDRGQFTEPRGGSLIQDRALDPSIQELAPSNANVSTLRGSISVLGDGFVEAIDNDTLEDIASKQPSSMRGQLIQVPISETRGNSSGGRFGWKDQHASLVSFAADAYKNEMGITSPLEPVENTSNGRSVADFDTVPDPDDQGVDVELFALFMRSTKAPPADRDRAQDPDAQAGSNIFNAIGCGVCHTPTIVTAAPGTVINGGALKVAKALGNKIIHPFGDFLLHDIGTGDGIVQNGPASTRNKVRTAPLWGLRARGRLMHDSSSFSLLDAIQRHENQAAGVRSAFNDLSSRDRDRLIKFLMSL